MTALDALLLAEFDWLNAARIDAEKKCHDALLHMESTLASHSIQCATQILRNVGAAQDANQPVNDHGTFTRYVRQAIALFGKRTMKFHRTWRTALRMLDAALERIRTFAIREGECTSMRGLITALSVLVLRNICMYVHMYTHVYPYLLYIMHNCRT